MSFHSRRPSVLLCWFCVAFIVYGSLFPFEFRDTGLNLGDMVRDWNPFHDRSDAVDNILLFIPLGIALELALRSSAWRWPTVAFAWLVLGVGLQVAQMYIPSRVASVSDAINNAIGLAIGMLAAGRVSVWLDRQRLTGRSPDRFALLLVAAWYAYESFPFIPTLDVGLLAGHIKPLLRPPEFEWMRLARHALAAMLGASALLAARPLQSRRISVGIAALVLFLSEVLVAYGDLRMEALLGIALGIAVAVLCERRLGPRWPYVVAVISALALLMTVLTPFRGPSPVGTFTLTPFSAVLWQGTTAAVPTVAFEVLAIGCLIWVAVALGPTTWRFRGWAPPVLVLMAALELLRRVTHSGPGDSGNIVVAALLLPFAIAWRHGGDEPRFDAAPAPRAPHRRDRREPARVEAHPTPRKRAAAVALGLVAVLTVGLWFLLRLPSIPYNVRELFDSRSLPSLAIFSVALLWLGAGPGWMIRVAARHRTGVLWLPVLAVAVSLISLLLLRVSVTQESLDDITGSTDLYRRIVVDGLWGPAWQQRITMLPPSLVGALERGVRYSALHALLLLPLATVALCVDRTWPFARKLLGVPLLIALWWLAQAVVIDDAITDNLVELIARGGEPWLAALLVVLAINVVMAAGRLGAARLVVTALTSAAALPTGWWLLKHGLEPMLIKYGQIFSALQFLLGRDRTALLTDHQLFIRWSALYLVTLIVLAIGMALVRVWSGAPIVPRLHAPRPSRQHPAHVAAADLRNNHS